MQTASATNSNKKNNDQNNDTGASFSFTNQTQYQQYSKDSNEDVNNIMNENGRLRYSQDYAKNNKRLSNG